MRSIHLSFLLVLLIAVLAIPVQAGTHDSVWEPKLGGFSEVSDIFLLSATEGWAVGSNIIRYNGTTWVAADHRDEPAGFEAIYFTSPDNGWAVGEELAIPFRNGQWGESQKLPGITLTDLFLFSATEGWAVGRVETLDPLGVVFRLTNGVWKRTYTLDKPRSALTSVWFSSPTDGWIAGDGSALLHLEGGSWQWIDLGIRVDLYSLMGEGKSDVWLVGGRTPGPNDDGGYGVVIHYDGMTWKVVNEVDRFPLVDIAIYNHHGYAIGQRGDILEYNNGQWDLHRSHIPANFLFQMTSVALSPGARDALFGRSDGSIFSLDAADGVVNLLNRTGVISGVGLESSDSGWAVGSEGAYRFDNAQWIPLPLSHPLTKARDVEFVEPTDGWAVGEGGHISHYDGMAWGVTNNTTDIDLTRVRVGSSDDMWALGTVRRSNEYRSVILHLSAGRWSIVWDRIGGNDIILRDIDVVDKTRVWAVGDAGVWEYDGERWSKIEFDVPVYSIDVISPSKIWVGGNGVIYHYNGVCWEKQVVLPAGEPIRRMIMDMDGTGWAVAALGYVMRLNGQEWKVVRGPTDPLRTGGLPNDLLDAVTVNADNQKQIWISGSANSILHGIVDEIEKQPVIRLPTPVTPPPGPPSVPTPTARPGHLPLPSCEQRAFSTYLPIARQDG